MKSLELPLACSSSVLAAILTSKAALNSQLCEKVRISDATMATIVSSRGIVIASWLPEKAEPCPVPIGFIPA